MELSTVNEMRSKPIEQIVFPSSIDAIGSEKKDVFSTVLDSAINNINKTNKYLSDAENEEVKLALGQAETTHDLAIALQKASTALQYTVAVRDRFLEAYRDLMNMQF